MNRPPQELTDQIRGVLNGNEFSEADLTKLANEYADQCSKAAKRLDECNRLLARGLRTEAIFLADTAPPLLDLVAILKFEGDDQWREFTTAQALSVPAPLRDELIQVLNAEYGQHVKLEDLVNAYRRLTMKQAAPSLRIRLLRQLCAADPGNPIWRQQLQAAAAPWLREIACLLADRNNAPSKKTVDEILQEINGADWVGAEHQPLMMTTRDSLDGYRSGLLQATASKYVERISNAYTKQNQAAAASGLAVLDAFLKQEQITLPADLSQRLDDPRAWISHVLETKAAEQAFKRACMTLEQSIDRNQGAAALERAYQATLRFKQELPDNLDSRYQQRIAALAAAARHRRRLLYSAIAAGLAVAIGAAIFCTYQITLSNEVNDTQMAMEQALAQVVGGELEKGQALRKQLLELHQRVINHPRLIQLSIEFDNAVTAERERRAEFEKHMARVIASGVTTLDYVELNRAADLAKTASETARVKQVKSSIDEHEEQQQSVRDAAFVSALNSISTRFAQARQAMSTPATPASRDELLKIRVDLAELTSHRNISEGVKASGQGLLSAVTMLIRSLDKPEPPASRAAER
ncbi:MAG: hypothetical protein NTX56_04105 [Proteobacteria bacterium]|nr:hypothetical protein [Pseudomonadota bacterium]